MRLVETALAKINLALHVRARRPDGYHEIETLFAFCRDGDTVTVETAEADSFALTGPFAELLAGEGNNLVLAARDAFATAHGPLPPLAITLDKRLPIASGIGGGSADAAATLRALGRLMEVDAAELADIALALGSDVPACLFGESAIGGGRGEELDPVEGLTGVAVLLVNPGSAVSTGQVFRGWDGVDRGPFRHPGLVPGSAAPNGPRPLGHGESRYKFGMTDWVSVATDNRNDLEAPAFVIAPVIANVLDRLNSQSGVTLARMSGSGATCFALFDSEAACSIARTAIAAAHPDWWCLESTLA